MVFASNIMVEPATMPGRLRAFVEVNPVSLMISANRGLMAGNAMLWRCHAGTGRASRAHAPPGTRYALALPAE